MLATAFVGIVAAIHVWIVVLEMVLWTRPQGRRAFGLTEEFAMASRTLAANQGLYNGFLVAALAVALVHGPLGDGRPFALYGLICVLVAGLYGAATVSRRILMVQALPAALGLIALTLGV